ncbi:hypothetical protein ACFPM1_06790 [Halorubrum rubrum]|uniref:Uncharacterized protein n=1 Tax=Halorubrum rubrum TaxID=1126240 RepID=A0ABD5R0S6_9EURY|nr:hypothetical protein [Halorubrum rubrum]
MLAPVTLGGAVMAVIVSVVMAAFALVRGLVDDLLLFPATILSIALIATTAVLSARQSPVLVIIDLGAVLIIAGMTLVYLDRLVEVSSVDATDEVHEQ